MNWEEYRKLDRMNVSTLVNGLKSMLHLKNAIDAVDDVQTPAMKLGTMIHCMVLEPEEFSNRYIKVPDFHLDDDNVSGTGKNKKQSTSKNTTYVKDRKSQFARDNAGKTFTSSDEIQTAERVAESVRSKPAAKMWLDHCETEQTILAEIEGVESKGKIDMLAPQAFLDLKTTQTVQPVEFWYQFKKLNYGFKFAWYRELIFQDTGRQLDAYCIAVESTGDFDCVVYTVPEQLLDSHLREVKRVLKEYKLCLAADSWPGVDGGDDYLALAVPDYAMEEDVNWEQMGEAING